MQATELGIPFEILLMDYASWESFRTANQTLVFFSSIRYFQLRKNVGRAKIRNLLAEKASFENLLFLDCDVEIASTSFLKNYMQLIYDYQIVSGGHIYSNEIPGDDAFFLHWNYGRYREAESVNFMSSNFMLKHSLWEKFKFDERITRYGHEDTLFQIELLRQGITIQRIDNPVLHIGLNTNRVFMQKMEEYVRNALYIQREGLIKENEVVHIRLLHTYRKLKRFGLRRLLAFFFLQKKYSLRRNLMGLNPSLSKLDLYKLLFLAYIDE
jgi:glycosyltransferase involved in cell wall biosynthesis